MLIRQILVLSLNDCLKVFNIIGYYSCVIGIKNVDRKVRDIFQQ